MSHNEDKNVIASIKQISKPLYVAAIAGAALTLAATISSFILNTQFLNQPASFLYHAQYAILLFGSFGVGYLLAKASAKKNGQDTDPIATGFVFALIGFLLFNLVDASRLLLMPLLDSLPFPLSTILFNAQAVTAVIIVALFGLGSFLKGHIVSIQALWVRSLIIAAFIAYQIVQLAMAILIFRYAEFAGFDFFLMTLGLLISPLTIVIIAYFYVRPKAAKNIATLVGIITGAAYAVTGQLIWEFRADPTEQSTAIFSIVATITTLLATAVLAVAVRRSLIKR